MRPPVFRIALVLGVLAAGSAMAATTARPAHETSSLTLYEKPDFSGRHVTFHASSEAALKTFPAHSARSVGTWTLCDGKDPASKCQTVTSQAATLKLLPAIVRPGVDAVALYDEPELKGKRVIYSFASDKPPPFKARSARTWGGAWSLCDAATGQCQIIDGERPAAVDVEVGVVRPGRSPGRIQLAEAIPLPALTELAAPDASEDLPPPEDSAPAEPASEPPPAPAAEIAASPPPPAAVAEAAPPPPPAAEPPASPYVDIPLPPRPPEPQTAQPSVEIPIPPPQAASPVRRVAYACADGQGLTVLFDDRDQTAMVLARDQDPIAMRRSRNEGEGGFFYEGSGHVLFGAGARAGYASDGARPVDCYARAPRRELSYRDGPAASYGYDEAPPAYYPPR